MSVRYTCHCKHCGKTYWSTDIVLRADICIACWLDQAEAEAKP